LLLSKSKTELVLQILKEENKKCIQLELAAIIVNDTRNQRKK